MAAKPRCPICGAKPTAEHAPFCSRHCADVDLGNWIGGRYRIPTEDEIDEFDDGGETGTGAEESRRLH